MNDPISILVVALLLVIVVAGAVMVVGNRVSGCRHLVRPAFWVILAIFLGLIAFYFGPGLIGGDGSPTNGGPP